MRSLAALAVLAALPSAQQERFAHVHTVVPPLGNRPEVFDAADVDGNGTVDVIVGTQWETRLWLGDGTGAFEDGSAQLGPQGYGYSTYGIRLHDVDGDGDFDAFLGNNLEPDRLLLNTGDGTFVDGSSGLPPGGDSHTRSLALGDLDGDGDADAMLGIDQSYGTNRYYRNDGTGTFTEVGTPDFPLVWAGDTNQTVIEDLDGDGDLDVVFAGDPNVVLYNDGTGVFSDSDSAIPDLHIWDTEDMEAGDVDADGDVDLLWIAFDEQFLATNDGAGVFADATAALPPPLGWYRDVALEDFDGDGDLDAFFAHSFSTTEPIDALYLNDGAGLFTDASATLPGTKHDGGTVLAEDLDGDGDVDVLLGARHQSYVYLNDGAGLLKDVTSDWPMDGTVTYDVALGDVDADGDLDALLAHGALYHNDGGGDFDDVTATLSVALQFAGNCLFGDVNGDGAADALLFSEDDSLHLADGTGGLLPASPFPADDELTSDVAMGDVDGDGDPDVLNVAYYVTRLYRNDGAGSFSHDPADTPAATIYSKCADVGDVDGDGDLDALIGSSWTYPGEALLLNDGAGVFTEAFGHIPAVGDGTEDVKLFDADGDGDLDAYYANNFGDPDRMDLNDGAGFFSLGPPPLEPGLDIGGVLVAADVDGDGDTDLFGSGGLGLNDGTGFFADETDALPGGPYDLSLGAYDLAAGDVDGDDDVDVIAARGNNTSELLKIHSRLFTNLKRQVALVNTPRIGKPYTLRLNGDPFSAFFLAWGIAPTALSVRPFGVLRLDPTALLVLDSSGLLNAEGTTTRTYVAPNDPAWVGVALYWQALLGTPLKFTNLEATVFDDL